METYQIVAGFSDIKTEFRKKTRTKLSMEELYLWFSFDDGVLYVHEYADHDTSMALAAYSSEKSHWRIFLKSGSYGEMIVRDVVDSFERTRVAAEMQRLYKSHGFIPFGRF